MGGQVPGVRRGWLGLVPHPNVLCYALGPFGGLYFLSHSAYRRVWAVRFHACHSLLLSGVFVAGYCLLTIATALSSWFFAALFREMRLCGALGAFPVWLLAMVAAYRDERFIPIPLIHEWAVQLARHLEHNEERGSAVWPEKLAGAGSLLRR